MGTVGGSTSVPDSVCWSTDIVGLPLGRGRGLPEKRSPAVHGSVSWGPGGRVGDSVSGITTPFLSNGTQSSN